MSWAHPKPNLCSRHSSGTPQRWSKSPLPREVFRGAWQSQPPALGELGSLRSVSLHSCSLFTPCLVQSPPPVLRIHTPGPQVTGGEHQAFEVLFKVPLRQHEAQEPRTDKLPAKAAPVPSPPASEAPSERLPRPPQGPAAAVLTSRKRFQYLSRSYWETVLSHWSLSRKLPLLGAAPPASASRCRLSTWRKHHAAAAAASTTMAGICGAGARGGGEPEARAVASPAPGDLG